VYVLLVAWFSQKAFAPSSSALTHWLTGWICFDVLSKETVVNARVYVFALVITQELRSATCFAHFRVNPQANWIFIDFIIF